MVVPNITRVNRNILLIFLVFVLYVHITIMNVPRKKLNNVYFSTTQNLSLKIINNHQKHSKYSCNIIS